MSELDKYYQILGLNPGASEKEIVEAYKVLAKVWHPDRFSDDPSVQKIATEKIKEIDEAYEKLTSCFAEETFTISEGKSYDKSQPLPHEPPSHSAKEQDATKDGKDQDDLQQPPEQPSDRAQLHTMGPIYAGFWNRFAAALIDNLIIAVGSIMLSLPFLIAKGLGGFTNSPFWVVFDSILFLLIGWLYCTLLESSTKRATIGKMAVGIIVTDLNENRISFGRANGRWWGKSISFLILGIGYIMAGFTRKKQALHDVMADTLVLARPEGIRTWLTTTIIGGMAVLWLIVITVIALNWQPVRTKDYDQTASAPSSSFSKEQPTSTQPPSETELNAIDWYNKGLSLLQSGSHRDAVDAYSKAIELNPNFVDAYYKRGIAYFYKGQHDQAISDYNKALEIYPQYAEAYGLRGEVYFNKGQHDQAISEFNKALEINPKFAGVYGLRGRAYYLKKEYDKSWDDIKKGQDLGYQVPPKFLDDLQKASGRKN